jgi:hypothetical protein
MDAHFAAMERRARMNRVAEIAEAPLPAPERPKLRPSALPRPIWPVDYAKAHAILDAFTDNGPTDVVTPTKIIMRETAREWGLSRDDMIGPRRTCALTRPRQVAMFLVKALTDRSLPDIGRSFGGRDHTTILHGARVTAKRMIADAKLRARVATLRARIEIALCEQAMTP